MTQGELLDHCLAKPGAFLEFPFGFETMIVKVKSEHSKARIFVQLFRLGGEPKVTFFCDRETGALDRLRFPGAVVRGYHCPPVQQPFFNTATLDGTVPDEDLIGMADRAYSAAVAKLPKKYQHELLTGECPEAAQKGE